jgi:hypothetical protein
MCGKRDEWGCLLASKKRRRGNKKDLKEDDFDFILFYWHHDLTKSIYQYPSISTFRLSTYFSLCCESQNGKKSCYKT